jgi:ribose 5-phosphate isomerase B
MPVPVVTFDRMGAKKVAIGSDHAGFELKKRLMEHLQEMTGVEVQDHGAFGSDSVDYPEHAHSVANAVQSGESDLGILICGSGNGVNIVANKHPGIRSALAWDHRVAGLARAHNNANVLALPARFIGEEEALRSVELFLNTPFEGGRHERRVSKIEPNNA